MAHDTSTEEIVGVHSMVRGAAARSGRISGSHIVMGVIVVRDVHTTILPTGMRGQKMGGRTARH